MRHGVQRAIEPGYEQFPKLLTLLLVLMTILCMACNESRETDVEPRAERLAVMAPALAEILDALDLDRQVVAVGDYVIRREPRETLPRIGAYDGPNIERIVELEVDVYLTTRSQAAARAHARLESLGVDVVDLDTSTLDALFESIEAIGGLLGREQAAGELVVQMRRGIEKVERGARGLERRSVLIVVGRDPLYVAGPGSHLDEMVRIAGGSNVFSDSGEPYRRVSLEAALERLPQIIIDSSDNRADAPRGRIGGSWAEWDFLPAVSEQRVYWLDPALLSIPGSRIPEMTRLVAQMVHPEQFGEAETFVAEAQ